jgi:SAM-dependent methyltransferase
MLEPHVSPPRDVLEVGCGAGANLARLYADGYRELHAVELSPEMVTTSERHYPAVAEATDLRRGPIERELPRMASDGVDATAAVAVLAHLHPDSEFVFDELVRVTADVLVTIENERTRDPLFVPWNYRTVFESRGCEQVAFVGADAIDDRTELSDNCRTRVFDVGRVPGSGGPERHDLRGPGPPVHRRRDRPRSPAVGEDVSGGRPVVPSPTTDGRVRWDPVGRPTPGRSPAFLSSIPRFYLLLLVWSVTPWGGGADTTGRE